MTTPERFRRRQRIEGAVLILLTAVMVIQSFYFNSVNNQQNDCIAESFSKLTIAQQARARIANADSKLKTRVISDAFDAKTPAEFQVVKDNFQEDQKKIDKLRSQTPIPPFPPGRCSG